MARTPSIAIHFLLAVTLSQGIVVSPSSPRPDARRLEEKEEQPGQGPKYPPDPTKHQMAAEYLDPYALSPNYHKDYFSTNDGGTDANDTSVNQTRYINIWKAKKKAAEAADAAVAAKGPPFFAREAKKPPVTGATDHARKEEAALDGHRGDSAAWPQPKDKNIPDRYPDPGADWWKTSTTNRPGDRLWPDYNWHGIDTNKSELPPAEIERYINEWKKRHPEDFKQVKTTTTLPPAPIPDWQKANFSKERMLSYAGLFPLVGVAPRAAAVAWDGVLREGHKKLKEDLGMSGPDHYVPDPEMNVRRQYMNKYDHEARAHK